METIKAILVSILALIYVIPTLIISLIAFIIIAGFTKKGTKGSFRNTKFYKIYFFPLNWLEKNWFK